MRSFKDKVILSTLPHILACYYAYIASPWYAGVIATSTVLSIAWHKSEESRGIVMYLDYIMAGAWVATEMILSVKVCRWSEILSIVVINLVTLITNRIELEGISYEATHTIWHFISFTKGILVSYILANSIR
jgi:hypothetical protein